MPSCETRGDVAGAVDDLVTTARKLAGALNETLDALSKYGVVTVSVVGALPGPYENPGLVRSIDRVSLCLDFRPSAKPEPA